MRNSPECQFSIEPSIYSQNLLNLKSTEDTSIEERLDHVDITKHRKLDVFSIENLIGENIEGS